MAKTAVGSPRSDMTKKKRAPFFGTFGLTDGSVRGSGRHRAYLGVDLGHALLVRVELRSRRALRVVFRGSLPSALLGLGLRVRGWLRLGSIVGCLGLGLGVGLRGFHLLGLGLRLGRGVQLGERPLEQVPNEPRLGAHRRRPRRHGAVRTGRALRDVCETVHRQPRRASASEETRLGSKYCRAKHRSTCDEAETLLGPRSPRGASSDHHDRIGHTRVRRPRRLRRTGVRRSGCVVRSTRVSLSTSPPAVHPERALFSCDRHPGHPTSFHVFPYTPAGRLTRLRRPSDLNPRLSPSAADETVALSLPCVSFHVGDDATENPGTLHVTTRRLVWFPDDATEGGYDVPLRAVAMHAVSSDESEGFRPCIYAQIEGGAPEGSLSRRFTPAETARDAAAGEEDGAAEEDETTELEETTELRLAPADPAALGALFKALCDCAALNPDPEDEMHETDDAEDDELYYDESEMATGAGAAARLDALRRFDDQLVVSADLERHVADDPGRFEDE